ncbi:murein transglycosylase [Erwinia psidii]|uniref:peptidoglycan lytic exotransglycosylase n=1 Tax=Erwinia psidii TaxID=69224 RepID=A0A3N6S295_9GAMM|nr:murein transglycosylase [Erwinia psidii]MCX8957494.1 murein transglycosylase [Erwinia psidii]MCX8960547.1 murein transglycosylase [Erwinia psidii]MCX8964208.1 murein transglycosylase [Erwinia psidii]RQM39684.1 murein transglycosylase [Erwinia psidii]
MVNKWQLWVAGVSLTVAAGMAQAGSLDAQRSRYMQIKQAWDNNQMETVAQLMPTLRDYPLYPYLEYRLLTEDLDQESGFVVNDFINKYPTLPPVRSLSARFVNELARRQDWRGLLVFSPEAPKPVAARCNWYYAKWATGQQQVALDGAKSIWLRGTATPAACDQLFSVWQAAGQQTPVTTLERIRLAMKEGNTGLVNALAKQLPADYQTIADAVIDVQNNPQNVVSFARNVGATDFTRQATTIAFAKTARDDAENALAMIPELVRLQKMSEQDEQALNEIVAWRLMDNNVTSEQARWRDNVVMRSDSVSLIERRVRMSLGNNDRHGLNTWIARLPVEAKQKDEWQYWQADLLMTQGRNEEAERILRNLMQERGFYPMVAAQRLGVDYSMQVDKAAEPDNALIQGTEIARVRELMYWGMDNLARTEWSYLVGSKSTSQQQQLARYARQQNWWDLSVQATITGKLWNSLQERFPLAWQEQFNRNIAGKAIPVSYAMAIARQESAWNPKARSPVGAAGLMQVMPATAQHTVKVYRLPGYSNSSQLLDPETNIQIGTQYLESVYQQFGQNRIFSSAAYNAGPSRVRTWLGNSAGRLDSVAFIETIPFSETRGYVKNVLAYDAYYRHFLNKPDKILSDSEWQRRY